ncbi:hypothetical protein DSM112329_00196 [Paraconexibacter sp. AEG42_29]|uniref:Uncharacterized protein n=1 Tax=Paraconexibacter sp. AEG42_29 TaxID=2997339 RepID=A0AAU7AP84_9ACTN
MTDKDAYDMPTSPDPEEALDTGQTAWLAAAREALAAAFDIPSEKLRVVHVREGATTVVPVVIDSSPNGTFSGTYDHIIAARESDPTHLTVCVAGERIDVLVASTEAAYRAMMEAAGRRGGPLPDSLELSQVNGELWTATMVLGSGLQEDGLVPLMSSSGGAVNKVGFSPSRGGRSIRVRPALRIPSD